MGRSHRNALSKPSLFGGLPVALVLIGYVFVIGGSSVGHGWKMLTHLAAEHHDSASDRAHSDDAHPAPGYSDTAARRSVNAPHRHRGRTHTHESPPDDESGTPVVLRVALDKHCLLIGPVLSPPPSRFHDGSPPPAPWHHAALSVETPPPRWG